MVLRGGWARSKQAWAGLSLLLVAVAVLLVEPSARAQGRTCGTMDREMRSQLFPAVDPGMASDCGRSFTNPTAEYDSTVLYVIPVVVHVILNTSGTQGGIDDTLVRTQIDILNEDFLALTGTPGAPGADVQIRFELVGITRTKNSTWFNDGGSYWDALAWDPNRYLNIYTNNIGYLGYVPFLPADGNPGLHTARDRVVILWTAFGRDSDTVPYDQGRTATHDVGHYLGLEHVFEPEGECLAAASPACYEKGDLLCDTNSQIDGDVAACSQTSTCASADPIHNYMNDTVDTCMSEFSVEQARRLRCTLEHFRPLVYSLPVPIFSDGFETGDVSRWTSRVP